MQALYAKNHNAEEDITDGEKNLQLSISRCYELSFYFFSLFPVIKNYIENKNTDRRNKNFPTQMDLNPNTKFIENKIIRQIEENTKLQKKCNEYKINWYQQNELIAKLFSEIEQLPEYQEYMSSTEVSYRADKQIVLTIIEKVLASNELLHWYLGDKYIHWLNDYEDALLIVSSNIMYWKPSQEQVTINELFREADEDIHFYKQLYRQTILHGAEYLKIIVPKLENWEADRIIETDMILMKMALCEILNFQDIPVKVSINEYIDIAKTFGSIKSGTFINGILDKIAEDLRVQGKLNKTGRGLLTKGLKEKEEEKEEKEEE